ncbi:amino acid adenylation domain-containing protein [Frankia sp. AgB32]|uniref:amino acid adenylation domain-containing protein n=1 Tax=Frankia sp. AgB32 TaxID=631119 RepID=UPI0020109286|nr:amino acid adenylation domain-containing protein [Frankia sp. AgB32]MCK9893451.1 amino acid adenylation domain-containing protein [Frankia sp. AgB32]
MEMIALSEAALAVHRKINGTDGSYPAESLKELFERAAGRRPEAVAVIHQERKLAYRELNGLANSLAARLRAAGVTPGDVVGLSVRRSPGMIVAMLAIIKCGATYLPFDRTWPDERLNGIFGQADCAVLLADEATGVTGRFENMQVLLVDLAVLDATAENPDLRVRPDALAYIVFTSGSTGSPKGVPIRHEGVVRLVFNARYVNLDENAVIPQLASLSFDAAVFEIWGALLNGGTCVLYPADFLRLSELRQLLRRTGATAVFLTTALFNVIVDEDPGILDGVQTVLTGGEAHSLRHVERARKHYGNGKVVSVYGPTECSVFATFYPVLDSVLGESALPIGLPIQNTSLYIVRDGALCAAGEVGEVCLAGPGLSPGYLGMQEMTSRKFVEYDIDGKMVRLYHTGDRGYCREDGNVVFQGRLDDQVKVNGFRIELGEIAHFMNEVPHVRQSYVTTSEKDSGEKVVVAFVVPADKACTPQACHDHLVAKIPGYMLPGEIHLCDSLPLTGSGKVDRRALLSQRRYQDAPTR